VPDPNGPIGTLTARHFTAETLLDGIADNVVESLERPPA
jgi:hypothetical protein